MSVCRGAAFGHGMVFCVALHSTANPTATLKFLESAILLPPGSRHTGMSHPNAYNCFGSFRVARPEMNETSISMVGKGYDLLTHRYAKHATS